MAIQDSNPERRNLTVLALSIIVFYLAEGSFTDDKVRLQLINATFDKPEILVVLVWLMLGWFCLRYWQTSQGDWRSPWAIEMRSSTPSLFVHSYLVSRFDLPKDDFKGSPHENRHDVSMDNNGARVGFRHCFYKNGSHTISEIPACELHYKDNALIFFCSLYMFFRKPTLSAHFSPYILTVVAVFLGLKNWIFPAVSS